ncbi:hypothetical protein roselon_00369 [Roseibacterium elongatum DSM 19469]|uniref:Uncharacterized protein n=1 Tax=Roseicyclus elongatus DSM 19469 TaxID=1294273 RepID=W8RNT8_9RHOB|nr:hypothetical protein roselon_00369 [Roseibacterium elongatum DSM 19469]
MGRDRQKDEAGHEDKQDFHVEPLSVEVWPSVATVSRKPP